MFRFCVVTSYLLLPAIVVAQERHATDKVEPGPAVRGGIDQRKDLTERVVELQRGIHALKAKQQCLDRMREYFRSGTIPILNLPPDAAKDLDTILKQSKGLADAQQKRLKALEGIKTEVEKQREAALNAWLQVMRDWYRFLDEKAELEVQGVGSIASVLDPPSALWVLVTWVVFGIGALTAAYEQRLQWRRFRRNLRLIMGALLFLLIWVIPLGYLIVGVWLASVAFSSGIPLLESPETTSQRLRIKALETEKNELEEKEDSWRRRVEKQQQELERTWESGSPPVALGFRDTEKAIRNEVRGTLHNAVFAKAIAEESQIIAEKFKKEHQAWTQYKERHERKTGSRVVRLGASLGAILFGILPVGLVVLGKYRRWKERSAACPRCLAEKLRPPVDPNQPRTPVFDLECQNDDPTQKCRYRFPQFCNQLPRLYFPTYGQVGCGKTFWLVTAYSMLNDNRIPVGEVKSTPVHTSVNERWNALVKMYLPPDPKDRKAVPTPPGDLPDPLLYTFTDADRLGNNEALLNLFDFSGETTQYRNVARNAASLRALAMDGFILFLDPTGDFEDQMRLLADFHRGLRQLSRIDPASSFNVPVAVCISKLDLLINRLGKAVLPWIHALRQTADEPINQRLIRKRSRLIERELPTIFGRDIGRALRDHFGRSVLWFPGTPVGLAEAELGIDDLTKRGRYQPFGILEPVLWLLHMSGYRVFGHPPRLPEEESER